MLEVPRSVRLALWAQACRLGRARVDEAVAAVTGTDEPHRITGEGLPVSADPGGPGLADWVQALPGQVPVRAVLPVPGDPAGVPAAVSALAVQAGQAVLVGVPGTRGAVLVPQVSVFGSALEPGAVVHWHSASADLPVLAPPPPPQAAARQVRRHLLAAARALEDLDLPGFGPPPADLGVTVRAPVPGRLLPPGLDPDVVDLIELGSRVLRMLALDEAAAHRLDHAQAVGGWAGTQRRRVLRELSAAVRQGLAAACADPGGWA